jgi:hypothetical protein
MLTTAKHYSANTAEPYANLHSVALLSHAFFMFHDRMNVPVCSLQAKISEQRKNARHSQANAYFVVACLSTSIADTFIVPTTFS